eukprot:2182251-Lingulodinium_polyedra.AAC.1
MLKEVAEYVSITMLPNDPVLHHFFPEILKDRGEPPTNNTEERRKQFLQSLTLDTFVQEKGPKASLSRFNSWSKAHRHLDKD